MVPCQYLQADEKEVMVHPWPWYWFEYTFAHSVSCLLWWDASSAPGYSSARRDVCRSVHIPLWHQRKLAKSPITSHHHSSIQVPALIQTRLEQITKQDGRVEQSTTLLAVAGRRERTAMDRKAKATSMNDWTATPLYKKLVRRPSWRPGQDSKHLLRPNQRRRWQYWDVLL